MAHYEVGEYANMVIAYVESQFNAYAAVRLYSARWPDRRLPSDRVITAAFQRFSETGNSAPNKETCGRARTAQTVQAEERILEMFDMQPTLSIRDVARALDLSYDTVQRTLKAEKKHAFHYTRVQQLEPQDYGTRLDFCRFLVRSREENPAFLSTIIYSDESRFGRDGVWNHHNFHHWADKDANPCVTSEGNHQRRFPPINLWARIYGNLLVST